LSPTDYSLAPDLNIHIPCDVEESGPIIVEKVESRLNCNKAFGREDNVKELLSPMMAASTQSGQFELAATLATCCIRHLTREL
jgi:hypothetical protein